MKFLILALCVAAAVADYTPLDASEYKIVKATWDKVKHTEVDILYKVFKAHPDIQAKFPQFSGKDVEGLKGTNHFATHATRIVSFLSDFVLLSGSQDNYGGVKLIVNNMAKNHKNRSISKEMFNEFRGTFIEYMSEHVDFNGSVEHAWNDVFDNLYYILFSYLDGHPIN